MDDLPEDWSSLAVGGLSSLAEIWLEQKKKLTSAETITRFHDQLRREWAIETGIIENLYSIDRGTTRLLIEKGIDASLIPHGATDRPAEEVVTIVRDQEQALDGLFDFVASRRDLSTSYIKEVHQLLTRNQHTTTAVDPYGQLIEVPLRRGDWKLHPNNPTRPDGALHEYCPPEHVASEMDNLIFMHLDHQSKDVPPEIEAAWLHHRFTVIHPFQDGNGRLARTLASLVFLRAGWFPLIINRDNRADYIEALEQADDGNLHMLVALFGKLQKKALVKALSLSEDVLRQAEPVAQVIANAAGRLQERKNRNLEVQRNVFDIASEVETFTLKELVRIARPLDESIKQVDQRYGAVVDRSSPDTDHWYRWQIVAIAKNLDYYANTRIYSSWLRLKIREEQQAHLIISLHSLGFEFVGVVAASAFIEFSHKGEEGEISREAPHVICNDIFQFTHHETKADVIRRYQPWLNYVMLVGVDQWRRRL